jgi:integrase
MLINQDFAQPEPKSPAKRRLQLVVNDAPNAEESSYSPPLDTATKLLQETIAKIDGAYAPSTIRAYRVDFQDLIKFCSKWDKQALPAKPQLVAKYIHKLNRLVDPTKDPDVILEMRRMHRKLGRSANQAESINLEILEKLLYATDDSIRGKRDRALLLVAYDALCRRSELVSLQVEDVKINIKNGIETSSILLRKSKTDQDSTGKWLHLSQRTHLALVEWMRELPDGQEYLMVGISRGGRISRSSLGSGQVNRIYKRIARNAGLDESIIEGISGHSMRVGAAQDLLNSGASMPIIMQRGRWSKTDTVMRYLEHSNFLMKAITKKKSGI